MKPVKPTAAPYRTWKTREYRTPPDTRLTQDRAERDQPKHISLTSRINPGKGLCV